MNEIVRVKFKLKLFTFISQLIQVEVIVPMHMLRRRYGTNANANLLCYRFGQLILDLHITKNKYTSIKSKKKLVLILNFSILVFTMLHLVYKKIKTNNYFLK